MRFKNKILLCCFVVKAFWFCGCASTTESGAVGAHRKQLLLVPNNIIESSAKQSYAQVISQARAKGTLNKNPLQTQRVRQIANKLIPQTKIFRAEAVSWNWEVNVITSNEVNAWCMPGGKIAFYSGIIEKLNLTDGEIAAIMGHEIAHALREHGRERVSEALMLQMGLKALSDSKAVEQNKIPIAAVASTLLISLPNSRQQETEADEIGLELMARAGYDPRESVSLWTKMQTQSGLKPPEFLSTHPSDSTRIRNLESMIPQVASFYEEKK